MAAPTTIQPGGAFGAAFGNSRPDPHSARRAQQVGRAADDFRLCACHRIAHNECAANQADADADDVRRDYFGGLTASEWVERNRVNRAMVAHKRSEAAKRGWETRRRRAAEYDPELAEAQAEAAREDARRLMARIEGTDGQASLQERLAEYVNRQNGPQAGAEGS